MPDEHLPVFVYGTLKRGEERSNRWPHPPVKVERATTSGRLRDLGPYPALVEGAGIVLGELWHLRLADLPETLRVLDEIECFGTENVDLYVRRIVSCRNDQGELYRAYTYFFADPQAIENAPFVEPNEHGVIDWRPK